MTPETEALLRKAGVKVPPKGDLAGCKFFSGCLIVEVRVPGRPIPWKPARVLRNGMSYKDGKLKSWQKTVGQYAFLAMKGMAPYSHSVALEVDFYLTAIKGRVTPDLSNLTKALEDSLQGTVIENDRRVVRIVSKRFTGLADEVRVRVYATEET